MSLDKSIEHGKEKREPYRRSQRFDVSCRNHGGGHAYPCKWCERNRLFSALRIADLIAHDCELNERKASDDEA